MVTPRVPSRARGDPWSVRPGEERSSGRYLTRLTCPEATGQGPTSARPGHGQGPTRASTGAKRAPVSQRLTVEGKSCRPVR
jgi:hypothetical protein